MERFSVKKPFTILVMVVAIIALGYVSLTRLSTDLLPDFSLPYLVVVAPYPGASPEKVEKEVAVPMENALGTVSGVKTVYSINNENYALIELEFEFGTDMDSAMVKVSSSLDQIAGTLPEMASSPTMLEISMDMLATMYVAVNKEGLDVYELSDYIDGELIPYLERQNGVASVNAVGLVEQSVQVDLNQKKIDELNDKILAETNKALAEAKEQLDEAQTKVDEAQAELEKQEAAFGSNISGAIFDQVNEGAADAGIGLQNGVIDLINALNDLQYAVDMANYYRELAEYEAQSAASQAEDAMEQAADIEIPEGIPQDLAEQLRAQIEQLSREASAIDASSLSALMASSTQITQTIAQIQTTLGAIEAADPTGEISAQIARARTQLYALSARISQLPSALNEAQSAYAGLTQAQLDAAVAFSVATTQLAEAQEQLATARREYESYRERALAAADVDAMLSAATLSQLIYAQNFSMPAGYIEDASGTSWLLKVGDAYETEGEIEDALLVETEALGDVRLSDIADLTVIDNSMDNYAKLNGEDGVILCIYKASTAGTNEVSTAVGEALTALQEEDPTVRVVPLVDQGNYITFIINDILSSMLLGAVLAILVLALFLRSVRPTIVVAVSIPLSVLFTLVLMYFSKLTMNVMTLSGIALGIGMLVDNSIVVMENIFRLRASGLPAPRAAVQGAKQVRGAIVASTLTTVCVFLPMVFTSGTVRELLLPMALSIGYCLMTSLLVALTVVPAASATVMRSMQPKQSRFFTRITDGYGKLLAWCLRYKAVPLLLSIGLLVLMVWQTFRTGIVMLPEMTADNIQVFVNVPASDPTEVAYRKVDEALSAILSVDGVENVGIMDEASSTGLVTSFASSGLNTGSYMGYVTATDGTKPAVINRVARDIEAATEGLDAKVSVSAGGMSDMSSYFGGSDLMLNVYGNDTDALRGIAADVKEIIEGVEGFRNVSDGSGNTDRTLHLIIDKDEVAARGLTIAQVYMQISERLTTSVTSTTITTSGGATMDVIIRDETDLLTKENLLDMEFSVVSPADAALAEAGMDFAGGTDLEEAFASLTGEEASGGQAEQPGESSEENTDSDEKTGQEDSADSGICHLRDFATVEETDSLGVINRENLTRYITVSASTADGYNTRLLTRRLQPLLDEYAKTLPDGYRLDFSGEVIEIDDMLEQMIKLMLLALLFIYLVMVAQFQSLLSPFIVFFTIPLAFTGGMIGLVVAGEQISLLSLMGFLVLMGTVVNNGIVFVDYANQLRTGGLPRREALIATGKTRMRPILMTALTTILAMMKLIFGSGMGSQLGRGMAIVIVGGLLYATLMTLFIVPVMYDILFKRKPLVVDVGDDLDDAPDDAAEYLSQVHSEET